MGSEHLSTISHAGITFHYQRFGRAYGTCSCGWPSRTVRFGRYNRIVKEWERHKACRNALARRWPFGPK